MIRQAVSGRTFHRANTGHSRRKNMRGFSTKTDARTTNPAEAGPVLAPNHLLLAARETESGKANAEKRERGGFGDRNRLGHGA
jgi:hypothetical protein